MTSLATPGGLRDAPGPVRSLLARLREECDRHAPFSQVKLLLREAASTIERLEADLAAVRAQLEGERQARQA